MSNQINLEILNGFINMIIMDVAQKYIFSLKNERKQPPKLIEQYLEDSVLLLKKFQKVEISKIKDTIDDINKDEQKEFKKLFEEYPEYELLCKELNFAYLLMVDHDLQEKTIDLLYDNIYEYHILIDQEIITKRQISINKVMEKSNKKKVNRLRYKNNVNNNYMRA